MPRRLKGRAVEEKLLLNRRIEGECWRWTGSLQTNGYGQLWVNGKVRYVHRIAYELWVGPIPAWAEIDHLCSVRDCIRPSHLDAVTHAENVWRGDGLAAINSRKTHCLRGHEFTSANTKWGRKKDGRKYRQCRRCQNDHMIAWRAAKRQTGLKGVPK